MTKEEYHTQAKYIWKTYVPKSGIAETIQGELMRSIEKLRDEAQRNGNKNWNNITSHEQLALFIQKTLIDSGIFDASAIEEIQKNIARILNYKSPATSDDVYDFIVYRIVEWFAQNKTPISNPNFIANPVVMTRDGVVGVIGNEPKESDLIIAIKNRDGLKVAELIKNGVNIEEKDPEHGKTPVYVVAARGYQDILELLIEGGVQLNILDNYGLSPLDMAVHKQDVFKYLKSKGAKSGKNKEI